MSNKALYISLIMTLLGAQAGLQTASGQDSGLQSSSKEESYVAGSKSTPIMVDMKALEANSTSAAPQATPQACTLTARSDTTDRNGDYRIYCTDCYYANPVCGTYQNDYPHRMTVDIEQNARYLHVKSWAPWFDSAAGPIWFTCYYLKCS